MANWKAVQYMVISTSAFTIMNSFVKHLAHLPTLELIFFRSLSSFILCMLILRSREISVLGNQRKLLLSRALVGLIAMTGFFLAVQLLPLGSAVTLRYLAPIFAAVLAVLFLKEKVRPIQWLFFAMAFGGVLLLKGFDLRINTLGLIAILISAIFTGMVYVLIRKIGQGDHPLVVVNYFMGTTTIVGLIGCFFHWQSPVGLEWGILLSLGFFGFFGQLYMTKAFQVEAASKIAPVKYMEVVFALLAGWAWFGESYSYFASLGILLIVSGMLFNVMVKNEG